MSILTIDVGTSSIRAAVVDSDGTLRFAIAEPHLPSTPFPGLVEFDASAMAQVLLTLATRAVERAGDVEVVGITNQRASAVVWDRATGEPIGPGLGWQDLRTVGQCLELQSEGLFLAPNLSATKFAAILDAADPNRERDLCVGTVDSWIAWTLTGGAKHVTDMSNATVTGLFDGSQWLHPILDRLKLNASSLPEVVDSTGVFGEASALPGAPPLAGILGDQQSSLVGQSCVRPGQAKFTFGTGGMLDVLAPPPDLSRRGPHGTFPIVAWGQHGEPTWAVEAVMLAAGTNIEWLRDDMGIIATAEESDSVGSTADPDSDVWFVPAPLGLGTPNWDFGARSTLLGVTRGTGRADVVQAVLDGVAHRAADLVAAAEADLVLELGVLRVDGGMSENRTFIQCVADATGKPIAPAAAPGSTSLGTGFMAGMAVGIFGGWDDIAELTSPRDIIEPAITDADRATARERWQHAVARAAGWIPELSSLDF